MVADDFAPASMAVVAYARAKALRRAVQRGQARDNTVLAAISAQLFERLPLLSIEPQRVLDLGCHDGYQFASLHALYPKADVVGLDVNAGTYALAVDAHTEPPLRRWLTRIGLNRKPPDTHRLVAGDPHALPFADNSFDLVISNLCLPLCANPHDVFAEVARVLTPQGAFLFSSLGPDTLLEYRQLWAELDHYPRVSGLIDMHDLGDSMLRAGLADPVLDRDNLQLDYPSVAALEAELQAFGLVNVASGRRRGLITPRLASRVREQSMRFSVGLELVHGHAWKGELNSNRHSYDDEFKFPVDELRGSWKR